VTGLPAVAARFALDAPVGDVQPFGDGLINDTYLVTTVRTEYVLQRVNPEVFEDPELVMRNIELVTRHLDGRYVPELVTTRSGSPLTYDDEGYVWRAWRRLPGAAAIAMPTPVHVAHASELLARFHTALADFVPAQLGETLPGFHDPAARLDALRTAVARDPHGRVATCVREIDAALDASDLTNIAADIVARVPCRVAHNDAQLNNVLFRNDDAVCLVDLDTVMPTAWFWDLGDLLRSASSYGAEDDPIAAHNEIVPELYETILTSYRRAAIGATSDELDAVGHAGPIVTYEQALRFLTDWIAGDIYYRTTRPAQNLDRARAQLALLASMRGTVAG
jgi:N-acetylhexosamine 1-kinase